MFFRRTAQLLVVLAVAMPLAAQRGMLSLGELRQQYVGKKVLITGTFLDGFYALAEWQVVRKSKTGIYERGSKPLPVQYVGKQASVVAVQPPEYDVFMGRASLADAMRVKSFGLVVQFEDGTKAMSMQEVGEADRGFADPQERAAHAKWISENAPSVIGKKLYAVAYSRVFPLDLDNSEVLQLINSVGTLGARTIRVSPLTALTIVSGGYRPDLDILLLKLKAEDGTEAFAVHHPDTCAGARYSTSETPTFLEKVAGCYSRLLTEMPSGLTERELTLIKNSEFATGMSRTALYMAIGYPERKNRSARGAEQLVYRGGHLLVYLDGEDRITNWQSSE